MIFIIIKNVHYNVKKKKLCSLISVCLSFEQHVAVVPSAGHSEAMHLRLLYVFCLRIIVQRILLLLQITDSINNSLIMEAISNELLNSTMY